MREAALKSVMIALLALQGPPVLAQQRTAAAGRFEQLAARAEEARSASRFDEAIGLYRKALSLRPRWAEGWWSLGTLLYERDAFADAAVAFGRATAISPRSGMAWAMLGLCEFKLGRFADALAHIRRGRQLGTSDEPHFRRVVLYHEGILLLGKGDFERAQETLGELSREGVEDETLTTALGLSALRILFSDLHAGDAALRGLVARAGRAEHLAAQRRFDEALAEYERLAAEFPAAPNVQYAFGRFLLVGNQDERAVEAFKREVENNPGHVMARLAVADVKFRLKDFAGGLPYAREAVKLAPASPVARFLLGVLLLETGQTARAIAELEAARKATPDEPKVHFQLGRAYAQAGRKQEAARARATFVRLSKQREAQEPGSPPARPQ